MATAVAGVRTASAANTGRISESGVNADNADADADDDDAAGDDENEDGECRQARRRKSAACVRIGST